MRSGIRDRSMRCAATNRAEVLKTPNNRVKHGGLGPNMRLLCYEQGRGFYHIYQYQVAVSRFFPYFPGGFPMFEPRACFKDRSQASAAL
jgi:hypothetical protein